MVEAAAQYVPFPGGYTTWAQRDYERVLWAI